MVDELERRGAKRALITLCIGGGMGVAGKIAADFGAANPVDGKPRITLEQTDAGKEMTKISEKDPHAVKMDAWTNLSLRLASGARGEVNVILGEIPVPRHKVVRQEIEELTNNPNVTAIKLHQLKPSPTGKYTDANGKTYDLVPISMTEALGIGKKPTIFELPEAEEEEGSS